MNEKYIICSDGFENVEENGKIIGYNIRLRIPYYRGVALSLIEIWDVKVDGESVPLEDIRFTTSSGYPFTLKEMETVTAYRWEYGEKAKLTVLKEGGLAAGKHRVEVTLTPRISYMPKGAYSYAWADLEMA